MQQNKQRRDQKHRVFVSGAWGRGHHKPYGRYFGGGDSFMTTHTHTHRTQNITHKTVAATYNIYSSTCDIDTRIEIELNNVDTCLYVLGMCVCVYVLVCVCVRMLLS